MSELKFSVLITVYNKEKYLAEAIESVLSQTFKDFEVIIVDDCSTDNSLLIAERLAAKDARINVYRNETNLGDYPNRNRAVSLASCEHLKFLDADDVMERNALWVYAAVIQATKGLEPLYYVNCEVPEVKKLYAFYKLGSRQGYRRGYIEGGRMFTAAPNSCLYRKSVLGRFGEFRPNRLTGDYEMAHRLVLNGPVGIIETPKALSMWRMHENQESEQSRLDLSRESDYIRVSLEYLELAQGFFSQKELIHLKYSRIRTEAQCLRSAIGRRKWQNVTKVLKNLNFPLLLVFPFIFRPYRTK